MSAVADVSEPLQLRALLSEIDISQAALARHVGVSTATVSLAINFNRWPAGHGGEAAIKARITDFLLDHGVMPEAARAAFDVRPKLAMACVQHAMAAPEVPETETPEEEMMLLPKQSLSDAARKKFGLFTNPFDGEVTSDEQMFVNGEIRFVHETAWQAAMGGRMVAVIGESGAGKTTMLDDLKEKILREHRPVVCIEPSVEGMEESDTKGKSIKSAEIHAAIVLTLDANASVAQSSEKRSRQVKRMLEESVQSGRSHLLIIEEAHALPVPTLNHLKRLHEKMRLGRRPMLGILLVGHPELEKKLNRFDVREVMQRTEIARLLPLNADLSTYLQLRATAAGRKLDEFITPDGVDELRTRLTVKGGGQDTPVSLLYPLNVNNWMVAALNMAAELGAPRVDRDVIRSA